MNGRTKTQRVDSRQQCVSMAEFHELTGISIGTLRRWKRRGTIDYVQPAGKNGLIRIPVDALERGQGHKTRSESRVQDAAATDAKHESTNEPKLPGRKAAWMKTVEQYQ